MKNTTVDTAASPPVLLTSIEAAAFLRVKPATLERWRLEGKGPRYTKVGPGTRARVVYVQDELIQWLAKFSYGSTSEYGQREP